MWPFRQVLKQTSEIYSVRLSPFWKPLMIRSGTCGARGEELSEPFIQTSVCHSILTDKVTACVSLVPFFYSHFVFGYYLF